MLVGLLTAGAVMLLAVALRRLATSVTVAWLNQRRVVRETAAPPGPVPPEVAARRTRLAATLAAAASGAALLYAVMLVLSGSPGLAAGAALGGLLFPTWVSEWLQTRQAVQISEQLDAAMAVMAAQLQAGAPVEVAMWRAAEVAREPLREVLMEVAREANLGKRFGEALEHVRRHPAVAESVDFQVFVTQLAVAQERGAPLVPAFAALRAALAERRRYRQSVAEQMGENLLQTVTIAGIGAAVLLAFAWLSPEGLRPLVESRVGQIVLLVSVLGNASLIRWSHVGMLRQTRRT